MDKELKAEVRSAMVRQHVEARLEEVEHSVEEGQVPLCQSGCRWVVVA